MPRRALLALLVLVAAIAPAALHMPVPSLPLLAGVFAAPVGSVQLVLTLFLAGIAVGQLAYGPVSDRFGRRPVLIADLALFLAGTLACGLAWSLPMLIVGRVIQACGGCAGMVLGRAIVRDLFQPGTFGERHCNHHDGNERGSVDITGHRGIPRRMVRLARRLALLGMLGAAVLALTVTQLEETLRRVMPTNLSGISRSFVLLLHSPAFLGFALTTAFTSASWFTFWRARLTSSLRCCGNRQAPMG